MAVAREHQRKLDARIATEQAQAAAADQAHVAKLTAQRQEAELAAQRKRAAASQSAARSEAAAYAAAEDAARAAAALAADKRATHNLAFARKMVADGYRPERVIEVTGWPKEMLEGAVPKPERW